MEKIFVKKKTPKITLCRRVKSFIKSHIGQIIGQSFPMTWYYGLISSWLFFSVPCCWIELRWRIKAKALFEKKSHEAVCVCVCVPVLDIGGLWQYLSSVSVGNSLSCQPHWITRYSHERLMYNIQFWFGINQQLFPLPLLSSSRPPPRAFLCTSSENETE